MTAASYIDFVGKFVGTWGAVGQGWDLACGTKQRPVSGGLVHSLTRAAFRELRKINADSGLYYGLLMSTIRNQESLHSTYAS
jgi:hypothetical protein